jgi:hypothetical protein
MRIKLLAAPLLLALIMLAMPSPSVAGLIFSVVIAPPPLPVYEQPLCPGDGYIWTPGYWAYDDDGGYFWVPGTWVLVPDPGFLWTPGWWGWSGGLFLFHEGFWGPTVGFYGGINYGFGYGGFGYDGGYWRNGAFFYNRSVNNVTNVTNVYNRTVIINNNVRNVGYNGGSGGIVAQPTAEQEAAARERHIPPTQVQAQHVQRASTNRDLFESANHGRPAIAATARPAEFSGRGVVRAKAAGPSYQPPTARTVTPSGGGRPVTPGGGDRPVAPGGGGGFARPETPSVVHPNQLPPIQRTTPSFGNPEQDRRYQQEQQKLFDKQEQERQSLQRNQEQEHQQMQQRRANPADQQRMEQRHQQQTQQVEQRHAQQRQVFEQRQQPKQRR